MEPLFAFLLSAGTSSSPDRVAALGHARIRILLSHKASSENWDPVARPNQREIVRIERDGNRVRLRLTEFE